MQAVEVLSLSGGHVNQELLLRNEYLAAETDKELDESARTHPIERQMRLGGLLKYYNRAAAA